RELAAIRRRELARRIGFVFQDPDRSLLFRDLEAEVAFGLENAGLAAAEIRRRVAETISALGLSEYRGVPLPELSGGLRQKVALAAALALRPELLLLDEPTAELDPVAAVDFLHVLKDLNSDLGLTVVLAEQRADRCLPLADRVVVLEGGRIIWQGAPRALARWAWPERAWLLPPVPRLFASLAAPAAPLTVKEGKRVLKFLPGLREKLPSLTRAGETLRPQRLGGRGSGAGGGPPAAVLERVQVVYPGGVEALREVDLTLARGELVCILGENGAGKSTLLRVLAGLTLPTRGRALVLGQDTRRAKAGVLARGVAYLAQDTTAYLVAATVREEVASTLESLGCPADGRVAAALAAFHLEGVAECNPRDLSLGQRKAVALAATLVRDPEVILLDEPTRGLSADRRDELGQVLRGYVRAGRAVAAVTHDVEFAAQWADRVVFLFGGQVAADGCPAAAFAASPFYAPQIQQLLGDLFPEAIAPEQARRLLAEVVAGSA
ncbi:MAG TPA: ATP-binding cassette domain-containing protein, partial [Firmicutes bacterium]|nr:ATP-binding cassette domain-containing protein [Bacillota bacterium]